MIDWQAVWNQYGFIGVVLGLAALALIDAYRNRAKTQNQTEISTANVIMVLAKSIEGLGDSISKGNDAAMRERQDNLRAITDMTGQMKGMYELASKTAMSQAAIATQVNTLTTQEFPSIKTDLADVKEKAANFYGAFDMHFEPVARLLNDVATLVRDWDARFGAHNEKVLKAIESVLNFIKTPETVEESPSPDLPDPTSIPDTLETSK